MILRNRAVRASFEERGRGLSLSFALLAPLALYVPLLAGCADTVPDTHEIVITEVDWREAMRTCTKRARLARACAMWKDHVCTVIVPEGNEEALEHELRHCREGAFHL